MALETSQSPSGDLVAVTPSDSTLIKAEANGSGHFTRGLYVGGAGNAAVLTRNNQTVTLTGLLAGVVYPIQISRVNSTNTTATNLVALF